MRPRRPIIIIALSAACVASGCSSDDVFSVRFPRASLRQVTREVRVFLFAPNVEGQAPPACDVFEPRGAPFGDAEGRTRRTAAAKLVAPVADEIGSLPSVSFGRYTMVIEAWSPRCIDVDIDNSDNSTFCRRTEAGPSTVMRAYACQTVDISSGNRLDTVANLSRLAEIGSRFQVPESRDLDNPSNRYTEASPLPVVEGTPALFPFRVQVLNELNEDVDGVAIYWAVDDRRGTFVGSATTTTDRDALIGGNGIASATLEAGIGTAQVDDGQIIVSAYAPGYENAPFRFHAKAVASVQTRLWQITLPESIDLDVIETSQSPVVYEDLNDDGRPDVLTVAGTNDHQLAALYDLGPDGYAAQVTPPQPRMARAIGVVRAGEATTVVVSAAKRTSSTRIDLGRNRSAYQVEDPVIELWTNFRNLVPADQPLRPAAVLTDLDGVPLSKVAIAMDVADIDDDGNDEVAMSRCSYLWRGELERQSTFTLCYGASVTDQTDSELTLVSAILDPDGELVGFRERAIIPYFGTPGGFRKVRLSDLNGDGSLDMIANNAVQVLGRCGARNQPSAGFGFSQEVGTFLIDTGFSQAFGLDTGRFNDDRFADIVTTGALRLSSADAGFSLVPGADCALTSRRPAIVSVPRTTAHQLDIRTADLNGDGWDDVLLLHRAIRQIQLFFGSGLEDLARGPSIDLPIGPAGELAIANVGTAEAPVIRAAIPARRENAILFVEFRPDTGSR